MKLQKLYSKRYFEKRRKLNSFFSGNRKWVMRNEDILRLVEPSRNDNILDIGCAEGQTSFLLHSLCKKIVGVDFSKEAIRLAREKYPKKNIKFVLADATNLDFVKDNSIDKISAIDFIEHINDSTLKRLMKESYRVLKKGGTISIYTPQRLHWVEIIKHIFNTDPTHIGVRTSENTVKVCKNEKFRVELLYFSPNPYPVIMFLDLFFMKIPLINKFFRFRICLRLVK